MGGNLLQDNSLRAYLRNDRYRQNEWDQLQQQGQKLYTAYRVTDELIGMTAFQMITFAVYLIFRAPYNQTVMEELNDYKNDQSYYQSRIYKQEIADGIYNYSIELELEDRNFLKPRLRYKPKTTYVTYPSTNLVSKMLSKTCSHTNHTTLSPSKMATSATLPTLASWSRVAPTCWISVK